MMCARRSILFWPINAKRQFQKAHILSLAVITNLFSSLTLPLPHFPTWRWMKCYCPCQVCWRWSLQCCSLVTLSLRKRETPIRPPCPRTQVNIHHPVRVKHTHTHSLSAVSLDSLIQKITWLWWWKTVCSDPHTSSHCLLIHREDVVLETRLHWS